MAARKKKTVELELQQDPKAPLNGAELLKAAAPVLKALEADLLARADQSAGVTSALQARHEAEKKAERTADNFATWRRSFVEQVAAAWFLSIVFVRTLEDRGLLERNRIAGEGALDSQRSFFALAPSLSERDYLLTVFKELSHLPAASELFDERHNPVWLLAPSAEAAQQLLALFRLGSDVHPVFRFGGDTRFLGDLYQDLSESVRQRFALLQTPRFVESYILDHTLEPALKRFGLDDTTLIDPTCGSGHFLLGAFDRLLERRLAEQPGVDVRQAAHKALDAVSGSDINPYAVSIARFRLTLAFLERAGYGRLKDAPKLPLHLAVADSLLHNPQKGLEQKAKSSAEFAQMGFGDQNAAQVEAWEGKLFALEEPTATQDVLGRRYAAVVGNPPYITVKDSALRKLYARMYRSCSMNYALTVPFFERFFELGREGANVGMITANSFMKREFGKKLIEEYLPSVNLTSVVNTSGAYIPGHGTPTVLIFGTAERPTTGSLLTVLANRGEPSTPDDPERGLVWTRIARHGGEIGFEDEYISVGETERRRLEQHPWSLGGGGASELKALLEERAEARLGDVIYDVGFSIILGEDELFIRRRDELRTAGLPKVPLVIGEEVRDWSVEPTLEILRPFSEGTFEPNAPKELERELWPWRRVLEERIVSGTTSMKQSGRKWYDVRRLARDKHRWPLTITFAFVATHNHFVLDRGGKVFNRSAPIIKLPESATEDDHYALLAYLNSSTACFWMKQVCHNKTNASQKHSTDPARAAYEFAGTALEGLPIFEASELAKRAARELDEICKERAAWMSGQEVAKGLAECKSLDEFKGLIARGWGAYDRRTARAVYLQEEIDWAFYEAAGLSSGCASEALSSEAEAGLGQRPFEVASGYQSGVSQRARKSEEAPSAQGVLSIWEAREKWLSGNIAVLEERQFKRLWRDTEQNIDQSEFRAQLPQVWLRQIVAGHLENAVQSASVASRRAIANAADPRLLDIAAGWSGRERADLVSELLLEDAVPYLDAWVYTDPGQDKRNAWLATWEAQRAEDRGERASPEVPPDYSQGSRGKSMDFRSPIYWSLRGKLDVPKERFISYPGCESDEDGEPVYGWAGWNHRQRAVALATLYTNRKTEEGWDKERLQPMLAGLLELLPWLEQWHNEPDAEFDGAIPAVQFREFLDAECALHGFTYEDLRAWRPAAKSRGQGKKSQTKARTAEPQESA